MNVNECPACQHQKHTGGKCSFVRALADDKLWACPCTADDTRKADAGKPRFDLIPPGPMLALAEIYEYGTRKYEEDSWREVPLKKYEAAGMRHYNAWKRGEKRDPESGKLHLAHLLWNVIAMMELDDA